MWVRFIGDFDWKPMPQSTIAYKAGSVMNVPRSCAEAAFRSEKAVKEIATGKRTNTDGSAT